MSDIDPKHYLVGGGIASLAAAVFLIRDGGVRGEDIAVLEASAALGGSLDAAGSPKGGYSMRGGRMLEREYLCTFGLFSSIPTLDGSRTVTDEIFRWNETRKTSSASRLFRGGRRQTAPLFGLREKQILTIERLVAEPEALLGRSSIDEEFDASFFETDFWFMWSTTFAFQPWHSAVELKRYFIRFAHMVDGFDRLQGIMRTVYNQYDSMVRPLLKWLEHEGVRFEMGTAVVDLESAADGANKVVTGLDIVRDGLQQRILVNPQDRVFMTLGSMTEESSLGTTTEAPDFNWRQPGTSWGLWRKIASGRPEFGHPWIFCDHADQSKWVSFTMTLHAPVLLALVQSLTGNVPGEGGLVSFPQSPWLLSIVVPHQPHFIGQPDGVGVAWGYGLAVDRAGSFVHKPMAACSGREIMIELLGHLAIEAEAAGILDSSDCVPCMMPFITSQFLPRTEGDRPQVIPKGWGNLAFVGQFVELPEDVVFTVEYSIRSAQTAVYSMLGLERKVPEMYRGTLDHRVLWKAFLALHDIRPSVPAALV